MGCHLWSIGRNAVSAPSCLPRTLLYKCVTAGRIPSAFSHLTMDSWDFSQESISSPSTSPSASIRAEGLLGDSVFEMDELRRMTRSPEGEKSAASFSPRVPSLDGRAEGKESFPGSIDGANSTASALPPSSYLKQSIHILRTRSMTPAPTHPPITSPPSSPVNEHSPSSSLGVWNKLRSLSSQTSLDWEKRHDEPPVKRSPFLAIHSQTTPAS